MSKDNKREEIHINSKIKKIVVYAKYVGQHDFTHSDWLILIDCVVGIHGVLNIMRHASYDLKNKRFNVSGPGFSSQCWGDLEDYIFYKATNEEKQFMIKELSKRGFKFVKILNKIIYR